MAFCACWRTMKVFKVFKANSVKVETIWLDGLFTNALQRNCWSWLGHCLPKLGLKVNLAVWVKAESLLQQPIEDVICTISIVYNCLDSLCRVDASLQIAMQQYHLSNAWLRWAFNLHMIKLRNTELKQLGNAFSFIWIEAHLYGTADFSKYYACDVSTFDLWQTMPGWLFWTWNLEITDERPISD